MPRDEAHEIALKRQNLPNEPLFDRGIVRHCLPRRLEPTKP
jgi:hypothetical protein